MHTPAAEGRRELDRTMQRWWLPRPALLGLWLATVGFLSTLFVAGVPQRYEELVNPCTSACNDRLLGVLSAGQQERLAEIGIDARMYAWWDIGRESAFAIAALLLGTVLIRRVGTPIAYVTATLMAAGGTVLVPEISLAGERADVIPGPMANTVWAVALSTIAVLWFMTPNGRFVPGWSWIPALAVMAAWMSFAFVDREEEPPAALLLSSVALLLFGIGAQIYRYRRASTVIERQQLKWLGVGLLGWLGSAVVFHVGVDLELLDPTWDGLAYPLGYIVFGMLVTLANGVFVFAWSMAILQHRLWDADRVLNRGVLAVAATATIVITYVTTAFVIAAVAADNSDIAGPLAAALLVGLALVAREPFTRRLTRLFYGERDAPYELLASLWSIANEHRPDADTVTLLAERLVTSLHLSAGRLEVTGESGVLVDRTIGSPIGTSTSIPLESGGEQVGVLTVWPRLGEAALSNHDLSLISNASAPIAHLAGTVRLTGDLRRSQASLVNAREEERRRIHRDLHDDLGPTLAGQALLLDAASSTIDDDPARATGFVDLARRRADEVVDHIRRMSRDLRPSALDQLGLAPALRRAATVAENSHLRVEADIGELTGLSAAYETAAYRIITEALTNAIRHSDARTILVQVQSRDGGLEAVISDDGRGGAPTTSDDHRCGVGLRSMHRRARELGGHVQITSQLHEGTILEVVLPGGAVG